MSNTAYDLTKRLLNALDSNYNVSWRLSKAIYEKNAFYPKQPITWMYLDVRMYQLYLYWKRRCDLGALSQFMKSEC